MSDQQENTAEPSAHRQKLAREMGYVPLAPALVRALVLAISLILAFARGPSLAKGIVEIIRKTWSGLPALAQKGLTARELQSVIRSDIISLGEPLLVVCLGTTLAALMIHQAATGGSWSPSLAMPKVDRLWAFWAKFDDESGSSRPPLSHRLFLGVFRPLAALAGCGVVLAVLQWRWADEALEAGTWSRSVVVDHMQNGREELGLGLFILTVPLICLGVVEMILGRIFWIDRLRPSADQARQEVRELEGDPDLKRRRNSMVKTIRNHGTVERLISETAVVIVGTDMKGLSVQVVRLKSGRLAVGQAVRGAISAAYAEKASAQGRPWLKDSKLARRLASMADPKSLNSIELPSAISSDIERRIRRNAG
jgi:flagellar biosynthesis protein FlhB